MRGDDEGEAAESGGWLKVRWDEEEVGARPVREVSKQST